MEQSTTPLPDAKVISLDAWLRLHPRRPDPTAGMALFPPEVGLLADVDVTGIAA